MIALEINKIVAAWKQTGLGVPRSGSGSQAMRRETSSGKLSVATYENNEITSHQQSTGNTHGGRTASFTLNGLLSPSTYKGFFESLLRGAFTATSAFSATTITISGTSALYTFTSSVGTPTFLTAGLKIGDVVRLSAAGGTAGNKENNILVLGVTSETVFTGITLNSSALTAEAIATCTVTVVGKKLIAAATAQTKDYWTIEEYQSDITKSEVFTDTVFGSVDVKIPASGNTSVAFNSVALNRSSTGAQVLTTPTAETTTSVVQGIHGLVIVNGSQVAYITGADIKIDAGVSAMNSVLGSNVAPDVGRGIIKVSGTVTAYYQDAIMSGYFDAATPIGLILVDAVDGTNASEFVSFSMSKVVLASDDKDNGATGIIRTYAFTSEINGAGGAALANDKTILTLQDSQA